MFTTPKIFTTSKKPLTFIVALLAVLILAGCATANRNYHGITLGGDVAFEFGKAKLTPVGVQMIDEYAEMIDRRRDIRVAVVGHADRIGDPRANDQLALRRAEAVRTQLLKSRLTPDQVVVRSAGSSEPVVECHQTNRKALIDCLAPNRRVEVFVNTKVH